MGVQIATRPTWALQKIPPEGCCFWRKQPCSPGRAGKSKPRRFRSVSIRNFAKVSTVLRRSSFVLHRSSIFNGLIRQVYEVLILICSLSQSAGLASHPLSTPLLKLSARKNLEEG
ncbi:hypothetical protein GmHk_15G044412 [Glycine max]|nr:hypothetical protein GmHk_15G044412 [Glycine max]